MGMIDLKRVLIGENSTIGELYGPDGDFWCHILEDPVRNIKIPGKTAIPAGTYVVMIGWSNKRQRPVPFILDVPFFDAIQMHTGNKPEDSLGCLITGKHDHNIKDWVGNSQDAFDRVFPLIRKLTERGETKIRITGGFEAKDWIKTVPGAVAA